MAESYTVTEGERDRWHDAGFGTSAGGGSLEPVREPARGGVRAVWLLAAGVAALIVAWAVLNFVLERPGLVILSQWEHYSLVTVGWVDKLLGSLVLFLLAADRGRPRLRWVAVGVLILALGPYMFELLEARS